MRNVVFLVECANHLVCMWVIHELVLIDKEREARSLEGYWQNRDIRDLVEVLEAAQFPE